MSALTCPETGCRYTAKNARDLAEHCVVKHDYAPSDGMVKDGEKT